MTAERFIPVDTRLTGFGWTPFQSYGFAKAELGVLIDAFEVTLIASFAPVAFLRAKAGYYPYAVFSLSGRRNAFVSSDDRWCGGYLPTRMRCYPFVQRSHPHDDAIQVRRDAVVKDTAPGAIPFLMPNGCLSEPVEEIERFLIQCRSETEKTSQLMRKVARLGLLRPFKSEGLKRIDQNRLFVVDWKQVNASRAVTSELSKDLLLQRVLHAHAVSLSQIDRLHALEVRGSQDASGEGAKTRSVNGFLDAVGVALDVENSEIRG